MKFELNAQKRTLQGSGASRRLRHANKVPGIIYGGAAAPLMIELPHNELLLALRNPLDPDGWHDFPESAGPSFRRARRIDVWLSADRSTIHIDSAFQDSCPRPEGGRAAIHEYRLAARADAATLELTALTPEPRILPFRECPGAVANAQRLIGTPLPQIRAAVLANLRGTAGCTHLNDALRALAEVPALAARL